jgi:hypothetical protein
MATTTSREAFEAVFPTLAEDLLAHAKKYNLPENALKWLEQVSPCRRAALTIDLRTTVKLTNILNRSSMSMFLVESSIAASLFQIPASLYCRNP